MLPTAGCALGSPSLHMFQTSESPLQTKLNGSWAVCVERVQEGSPRNAVGSSIARKAGGIDRTRIATDDVVSAAARIVGIVSTELRVIEDVEKLHPKLNLTGLVHLEVLYQC